MGPHKQTLHVWVRMLLLALRTPIPSAVATTHPSIRVMEAYITRLLMPLPMYDPLPMALTPLERRSLEGQLYRGCHKGTPLYIFCIFFSEIKLFLPKLRNNFISEKDNPSTTRSLAWADYNLHKKLRRKAVCPLAKRVPRPCYERIW